MTELTIVKGPFSLQLLEKAYQEVVYGYDEPNILRCSETTRERLRKLHRFSTDTKTHLLFNNACVTADETFPDNRLRFENTKYPDKEKLYFKMNIEVELTD